MAFRACVVVMILIASGGCAFAESRLRINGTVDGKPARFMLDTGLSYDLAALPDGAGRLGLSVVKPPSPEDSASVLMKGFSATHQLRFAPEAAEQEGVFVQLKAAPEEIGVEWDFDAMIGWPAIRANVLYYALGRGAARLEPSVLIDLSPGQTFPLVQSNVAVLDVGSPDAPLPVMIDTGANAGVQLSAPLWKAWREAHPLQLMTLRSAYSPATGTVVTPQGFAPVLRLGRLTLRNVLVSELPESRHYGAVRPEAILGLDVFSNQDLYLDGPGKKVVILPPAELALVDYNRIGAAFTPPRFAAQVVQGGPASRADIRDGDVLVRLDGLTPQAYAAKVTAPSVWMQPNGTPITLTLRRGEQLIERRVVLEDFLGQTAP